AVERHARGADVVARIERGHAPEVARLLADLGARAPDDVVDVGGAQRIALGERAQDGGAEVLRMHVREGALAGLADAARRAAGVDDQCVGHLKLPFAGESVGRPSPPEWVRLSRPVCLTNGDYHISRKATPVGSPQPRARRPHLQTPELATPLTRPSPTAAREPARP